LTREDDINGVEFDLVNPVKFHAECINAVRMAAADSFSNKDGRFDRIYMIDMIDKRG